MINWPTPTTMKQLREVLGLTEYYRRFLKDYGKIAKPLATLLKKGGFTWNQQAELAFPQHKTPMSKTLWPA